MGPAATPSANVPVELRCSGERPVRCSQATGAWNPRPDCRWYSRCAAEVRDERCLDRARNQIEGFRSLGYLSFPVFTSWTMLAMLTTGASLVWRPASNRSPEEQGSTPVPHHAAGGRLSLLRPSPGEQGSIPKQRTGSGMDPPVFWAGNTGKSQTTHSVSPFQRTGERDKPEQSGRRGQSVFCRPAEFECPFRFRCQPPPRFSPWGQGHLLGRVTGQSAPCASSGMGFTGCGPRKRHSVLAAIPSWALRGEKTRSLRSRPGRARITPPGFYGSGNPGKARQHSQYPAPTGPPQGFPGRPAHIVCRRLAGIRLESHRNQAGIPHARQRRRWPLPAPAARVRPSATATADRCPISRFRATTSS